MKVSIAIFLLIVVLPLTEFVLLLQAGELLGLWPTVALVLLTGVIGSKLAFREGTEAWRRLGTELSRGAEPTGALLDGLVILASGILLMAPGLITDTLGLLGLFAPSRRFLSAIVRRTVVRAWGMRADSSWQGTGHSRPTHRRGEDGTGS